MEEIRTWIINRASDLGDNLSNSSVKRRGRSKTGRVANRDWLSDFVVTLFSSCR